MEVTWEELAAMLLELGSRETETEYPTRAYRMVYTRMQKSEWQREAEEIIHRQRQARQEAEDKEKRAEGSKE